MWVGGYFFFFFFEKIRLNISCEFQQSKCLVLFSLKLNNKKTRMLSAVVLLSALTLKMPRKPASKNVVCLCRLLNILANFSNLFLHTGKKCGLRSDCS